MKFQVRTLFLLLIFLLFNNSSIRRMDYRDGMQNNVCKELKETVLVYFVFVDTKETAPWTEFDIQTTLDSIQVAVNWLEETARKNNISLNIITDYYIGFEYSTIRKNLEFGTVKSTATTPNLKKGLQELSRWSDAIAARIGKEVEITTKDGIPEIKHPKNKERLVAHLRDKNQIESVALLFMVNNYYRNDISLAVNHLDTEDVEFAIVSYKYPAIIAQNILNLFGAADMYESVYRRNSNKIKLARQYFPNDIMQDVYARQIKELEIGELSKYLIGWSNELNPKYESLLYDNIFKY